MKKALYIVVFCFAGCASQLPLDDAYYWPDKKAAVTESKPVADNPVTDNPSQATNSPSIEIISQQDTTITVKIKR